VRRVTSCIRVLLLLCAFTPHPGLAAFERGSGAVFISGSSLFGPLVPALPSRRILLAGLSPGLFGIVELAHASVAYQEPLGFGTVTVSATRLGTLLYKESTVALSFIAPVAGNLYAGVALSYNGLTIEGYGSDGALGIDAGCILPVAENLSLVAVVRNVNRPTIGSARDPLPQVITTALSFKPAQPLRLVSFLEKESDFPTSVGFGMEYTVAGKVTLGGGMNLTIPEYSASVGLETGRLMFSYSLTVHPLLGPTHHASIAVDLSDL
jgi:hypothetical protein